MNGKRQKTSDRQQQLLLAFATEGRDEVPDGPAEGTVPIAADSSTESPTSSDRLMERICDPLNFEIAMARVIANGGSPGVDGMTVKKLEEHFERHGHRITEADAFGDRRRLDFDARQVPAWRERNHATHGLDDPGEHEGSLAAPRD